MLSVYQYFYHVSRQPHLKVCHRRKLATLFMNLIEQLISQARASQVLIYKNSKQKILDLLNMKILNYRIFNWIIQYV